MRGDAQQRKHKVVAARTHMLDTARTSPERSPGAARSRGGSSADDLPPKGSKQRGALGTLDLLFSFARSCLPF